MENQTSEETQEETSTEPEQETQEETSEETSEETVKKETSKTSETVDYEKKFKESQKEAIRLKKENDEFRKEPKSSNPAIADVDAIVEVQQATEGLSPVEIAELRLRASANKSSLSEARKDENFILWQKAKREKVELDNQTLSPSTRQGTSKRKIPLNELGTSKEDLAVKEKFLKESGWKGLKIPGQE